MASIRPFPPHIRVRVWAVIGQQNSGKSSTVGSLMSETRRRAPGGPVDITLRGGGWLRVYCYRQSAQEAKKSPAQCIDTARRKALVVSRHRTAAYINFLIALRSDVCNNQPKAAEYLSRFVEEGFELQSILLLDLMNEYDHYAKFGVPTGVVVNSKEHILKERERGWIYSQARNHFGWA